MAYEAEGRQIAQQVASNYGKVREVRLESKSPSRIVLVCDRGELELPSNFIFQFGYSGSGPSCFHSFLQASGFRTTKAEVESAEEGDVFRR